MFTGFCPNSDLIVLKNKEKKAWFPLQITLLVTDPLLILLDERKVELGQYNWNTHIEGESDFNKTSAESLK